MLLTILLATTISGLLSLAGAFFLSKKSGWEHRFSVQLTAFAAGVMLTTSLLHLAPEALEELGDPQAVFGSILIAIFIFYLLERSVLWFHHHHDSPKLKPSAWLILIGDSMHNIVDGVAIAAAFLINPALGITTTIAVGLHEIPQEIADFIVLVRGGMSKTRALIVNVLSACTAIIGAIATYFLHDAIEPILPFILAFSAGMFLYIALSDLIPELHHHHEDEKNNTWHQIIWFVAGIALIFSTSQILESYIHAHDDDHADEIHSEEDEHIDEENHEEDEEFHLDEIELQLE